MRNRDEDTLYDSATGLNSGPFLPTMSGERTRGGAGKIQVGLDWTGLFRDEKGQNGKDVPSVGILIDYGSGRWKEVCRQVVGRLTGYSVLTRYGDGDYSIPGTVTSSPPQGCRVGGPRRNGVILRIRQPDPWTSHPRPVPEVPAETVSQTDEDRGE